MFAYNTVNQVQPLNLKKAPKHRLLKAVAMHEGQTSELAVFLP